MRFISKLLKHDPPNPLKNIGIICAIIFGGASLYMAWYYGESAQKIKQMGKVLKNMNEQTHIQTQLLQGFIHTSRPRIKIERFRIQEKPRLNSSWVQTLVKNSGRRHATVISLKVFIVNLRSTDIVVDTVFKRHPTSSWINPMESELLTFESDEKKVEMLSKNNGAYIEFVTFDEMTKDTTRSLKGFHMKYKNGIVHYSGMEEKAFELCLNKLLD